MTRAEAEKIAAIFLTVDNGCSYCIESVCAEANGAQLGWRWVYLAGEPGEIDSIRVEKRQP